MWWPWTYRHTGAAGGAGNGGILQHQGHFLFGGIYKDAALGHGAGDHIGAARRDGHHAVCHFRAGAGSGRRLPGKGDGGGTAYIRGLHIGGGIRGGNSGRCVFIGGAASGGSAAFAAGGKAPASSAALMIIDRIQYLRFIFGSSLQSMIP